MRSLHVESLRVAWVDTDASGRIHFTAAFRWAETAEHGLLRALGCEMKGEYPRRHVEATYHHSLHFDEPIELHLDIEDIGRTSVTYRWQVLRAGMLAVEGRHVAVRVNDDGRPIAVGPELRGAFAAANAAAT
jgi:YbgC/YbaW family acyl-CoA thioester hydrolase